VALQHDFSHVELATRRSLLEEQYPDFENNFWPGRWEAGCTIDEEDRVWLFGGYVTTTPNYSLERHVVI
jgi:hypothetical protein